jgi:ParB family transcriptional regulator, chromosome partitioning protein
MMVPINDIRVGKRLRGLREATVAELVESIGRLGLQVPISVATGVERRRADADGVSFELVAGQHRLEACKRLGWAEIEARIVELNDDQRDLWEIDENLCRAELSELERGEHLAKRKEVYERLNPETRPSSGAELAQKRWADAGDNLASASFAADTAERIGASKRDVQRSIRRVVKIDEKVRDRIRDNPEIADSGVELDALASLDPQQQQKAISLVESGKAAGIRDAKRLIEPQPPVSKEAQIRVLRERQAATTAPIPSPSDSGRIQNAILNSYLALKGADNADPQAARRGLNADQIAQALEHIEGCFGRLRRLQVALRGDE